MIAALSAGDSRLFHFSRGEIYSSALRKGTEFVLLDFREGDMFSDVGASSSTGDTLALPLLLSAGAV